MSWVTWAILLAFAAGAARGVFRHRDAREPSLGRASSTASATTPLDRDPLHRLGAAAVADRDQDAAADALRARLDTPARRHALDGAWVIADSDPTGFSSVYTQPMAIVIAGARATEWDGRAASTSRVDFDGPCLVSFMKKRADGNGEGGSIYTYVVHDGAAELGTGDVGERVGAGAIVCADSSTLVLDEAGRCTRIKSVVGWRTVARCGFRRDGGHDVFFYEPDPAFGVKPDEILPVDGWRIGNNHRVDADDPTAAAMHRYPDEAAARAVVDADARANDPLLIAQAAGGTIGNTSTVPGLVATYAHDRESIDEKVVRVTGVIVAHAVQDPDAADPAYEATTLEWITLAGAGHRDRPTIQCTAKGRFATAIADGAVVQVEGKISHGDADWTKRPFAVPALEDCRIVTAATATLPVPARPPEPEPEPSPGTSAP